MDNIIPVFYSEYGRYISRSRMIPSNIDGLIPVNRRLLLVMHKIAKKTTKSARIVGETIGTLHAHGDCLRGSTLIPLLDGSLVPISELCGKEPQWVLTYDKEKQDYIPTKAHSWRVGQITKELYKIHLSNGGIIECTANHPFLLNTQKWSRADELNCGDVLFGGLILRKFLNNLDILKHILADCGVYIIKIEKIILDKPEEFYDFTVDNYHNMIIATTDDPNNINFVIAHNSSAYGSLVNLVYDGYADSSKSTWGGPGLVDVPAPASRYTETSILPWVEKLAFEFIDFVPWELLELSEEPLYLPSPIPIGLVGDGIISGISYHKTVIPRYDKKDLVKRLLWLIQNGKPQKPVDISEELDPKIYGPCIKPKKEDCDVDEFSKNDFYRLLIFGEGKVIYKPKANIITEKKQTFLEILGKAPLSTFQPMLNAYSKNLLPFTEKPIDQSKKTNIRILAPLKKNISNTFLNEFKENYLNKPISFKCYFCDLDGKVNQYGVDDILLNSFNHWYQALLKKLLNDIHNINYKLFLNTISFMIKNILHNNKKIMSVDDIIKNFDFNQKIKQYDYQNKKWIILNKEITETDVRETCKNVSIQKLIEYHSIEENLKEQFQLIKNNIDNINNYILIKIKDVI